MANDKQPKTNSIEFNRANNLLKQANLLEKKARNSLLLANRTRQEISTVRVKIRRENDTAKKQQLSNKASLLATDLTAQQSDGASFRSKSQQLLLQSTDAYQKGLVELFGPWITNQTPLTMDPETLDYISHNAAVRSVHPSMLNKMGTASDKISRQKTTDKENIMTLKIAALMGQSAPADLNVSAFRLSNEQQFFAHVEVHNASEEQRANLSQVPLNQMHQWRLIVSDIHGNAVTNAAIKVLGHMPGHVHGLPTQPQVTQEISPGVYLVEGFKFQMQGWWVIQFEFIRESSEAAELNSDDKNVDSTIDTLTFNLIL
jgi:hypothetical protein